MKVVIVPGDGKIDPQAREFLQQAFRGEIHDKTPCEWCGGLHQRQCRRVKRMVFHASGERVQEIEFWPDGQWDESNTIWPEEAFDE